MHNSLKSLFNSVTILYPRNTSPFSIMTLLLPYTYDIVSLFGTPLMLSNAIPDDLVSLTLPLMFEQFARNFIEHLVIYWTIYFPIFSI